MEIIWLLFTPCPVTHFAIHRIYATDEDIVPEILYIQKVRTDGEFDLDYIFSSVENPKKGCCRVWVSEGKRPHRIVYNIPDGWIGVEEDLPVPGKLNENTLDYQKYMCLVQVAEGKSADTRPLAFTESRRWVNGNVDMTDYVLAWQDIPYQCCKGNRAQPTPFWYLAQDVKEYKK